MVKSIKKNFNLVQFNGEQELIDKFHIFKYRGTWLSEQIEGELRMGDWIIIIQDRPKPALGVAIYKELI